MVALPFVKGRNNFMPLNTDHIAGPWSFQRSQCFGFNIVGISCTFVDFIGMLFAGVAGIIGLTEGTGLVVVKVVVVMSVAVVIVPIVIIVADFNFNFAGNSLGISFLGVDLVFDLAH